MHLNLLQAPIFWSESRKQLNVIITQHASRMSQSAAEWKVIKFPKIVKDRCNDWITYFCFFPPSPVYVSDDMTHTHRFGLGYFVWAHAIKGDSPGKQLNIDTCTVAFMGHQPTADVCKHIELSQNFWISCNGSAICGKYLLSTNYSSHAVFLDFAALFFFLHTNYISERQSSSLWHWDCMFVHSLTVEQIFLFGFSKQLWI